MPMGLVFYYVMMYNVAIEIFELDAYAAVTMLQQVKTPASWTIDQRELYEKFKVFLIALFRLVISAYLLGLLSLLNGKSYLTGAYTILNMALLVSPGGALSELFPFDGSWSHSTIAFVMTILVFTLVLLFYTTLYSLTIMFRYNKPTELCRILFACCIGDDHLCDISDDQRINDNDNLTEHEGEGPGGFYYKAICSSTSSSSSSSEEDGYDKRRAEVDEISQQEALLKKTRRLKTRPSLKIMMNTINADSNGQVGGQETTPSIAVTTPTPSPTNEKKVMSPNSDFFAFAHNVSQEEQNRKDAGNYTSFPQE